MTDRTPLRERITAAIQGATWQYDERSKQQALDRIVDAIVGRVEPLLAEKDAEAADAHAAMCTAADRIVDALPPHRTYVEPFAGSLAVLLAKPPALIEVVNDLDRELVVFWRVLQQRPEELIRVCALTPHARAEYEASKVRPSGLDELELARRVRPRKVTIEPWSNEYWHDASMIATKPDVDWFRLRPDGPRGDMAWSRDEVRGRAGVMFHRRLPDGGCFRGRRHPMSNWREQAACRGNETLFFTVDGERGHAARSRAEEAKSVCAGCSVVAACLAAHRDELFGVFGGTTPQERRGLRRTRRWADLDGLRAELEAVS